MKAADWMFPTMSRFSLQTTTLAPSDVFHAARRLKGRVEQVYVQHAPCMFMWAD
jgi:hypothetical protein